MSDYTKTRDTLSAALLQAEENGPEWIKLKATIAALDAAAVAEASASFAVAAQRLDDAAARLQAIVNGIQPEGPSRLQEQVTTALGQVHALSRGVQSLLSGEPASALPGMPEVNRATFPTPKEPIVPPFREMARTLATRAGERPGRADVERMIDDILRREGGFVNHPNDRGGPTRFGITLRTLGKWRRTGVDAEDVRNLGIEEAEAIYRANYFTGPKIHLLPERLQPLMFDMSINHGPATAVKLLQRTLNDAGFGCSVDGGIGEETVRCAKAAEAALAQQLVNRLVEQRVALYRAIVAGDASQKVFLAGWMNRASEFRTA